MRPYYERDGIVLYHGDCLELLSALPAGSVDLLLTDPPYGQRYRGQSNRHRPIANDTHQASIELIDKALRGVAPALAPDAHLLVFSGVERLREFKAAVEGVATFRNALIWHKARGGMGDLRMQYAPDYEVILYATRGRGRAVDGRREGAVIGGFPPPHYRLRTHPTEKPVELLKYLVRRHAPADGLVLDLFAGTGSALLAAQAAGRRAIGIELDERYCADIARRVDASEPPVRTGAAGARSTAPPAPAR